MIKKNLDLENSCRTIRKCMADAPCMSYKKVTNAPAMKGKHKKKRIKWEFVRID